MTEREKQRQFLAELRFKKAAHLCSVERPMGGGKATVTETVFNGEEGGATAESWAKGHTATCPCCKTQVRLAPTFYGGLVWEDVR